MTNTLDINALSEIETRPFTLVEIHFSPVLNFSSLDDLLWDNRQWRAASLRLTGLNADATGRGQAQFTIGNTDSEIGALLLNQRIKDRRIEIYEAWFRADGSVMIKSALAGVGSGFAVGATEASITVSLFGAQRAHSPREMIAPESGFTRLRPAGSKIVWGGQAYILERGA